MIKLPPPLLCSRFTFHSSLSQMLWLTKWHTVTARKFDVDCMSMVLSSLFIANFEIESILIGVAAGSESDSDAEDSAAFNFAFQMVCPSIPRDYPLSIIYSFNVCYPQLFHPLHRIQRNGVGDSAEAAVSAKINLFFCPSKKILPDIQVRIIRNHHTQYDH